MHDRAAVGLPSENKKYPAPSKKGLTSSPGASLSAPKDAPASAKVSIDDFKQVRTKVDVKERSKDSLAEDQS